MKSIYIPGIPDVKMRPRVTKKGHVYDPNVEKKEASIQKAVLTGDTDIYEGPLYVALTFVFPRPKKHYRTGSKSHLLKDDAPFFFDTSSIPKDGDNMEKFYCDSFNAIHYRDDRQIVKAEHFKRWAFSPIGGDEIPHVEIRIYKVGEEVSVNSFGEVKFIFR